METFQSERGDDYRVWSLDLMVTTHVTARLLVAGVLQNITISMGRSRWWVENIDPSLLLTNITPIHRPGSYILLAQFTFLRREVVLCYIFVVWLASQMLSQMISGHVLWPSPSHSTMFVQPSPSTLTSSPDGDYCQEFNTNWAQCCAGWCICLSPARCGAWWTCWVCSDEEMQNRQMVWSISGERERVLTR